MIVGVSPVSLLLTHFKFFLFHLTQFLQAWGLCFLIGKTGQESTWNAGKPAHGIKTFALSGSLKILQE